jgi:hypothetical protein
MNKNEVRKYTQNIRKKASSLLKHFEEYGEKISAYHSKKIELENFQNPKTIATSVNLLLIKDKLYLKNKTGIIHLEKEINTYKYKIEQYYQGFLKEYLLIKEYQQKIPNLSRVEKNNLRLTLLHLNKQMDKINHLILVELNAELNLFLEARKKLKIIVKNVLTITSILLHSMYSDLNFSYGIKKYSEIKKISINKMETGDIIIYDEYESYKKSIAMRQIKYFVKSTILHVSMFYGNENNRNLIYEASGRNRKKSYIGDLKLERSIKYIVLRLPKNFTKKEKKLIKLLIQENVNQKFSIIKLYGIALNYVLLKIYKTWFPFITKGKNIYFGKGIFCSQTIGEIYEKLGINISNTEDLGMLSPLDIFNSFELDIIGYIEV